MLYAACATYIVCMLIAIDCVITLLRSGTNLNSWPLASPPARRPTAMHMCRLLWDMMDNAYYIYIAILLFFLKCEARAHAEPHLVAPSLSPALAQPRSFALFLIFCFLLAHPRSRPAASHKHRDQPGPAIQSQFTQKPKRKQFLVLVFKDSGVKLLAILELFPGIPTNVLV